MWLGPGWGPETPVGAPCSVVAWLVSRKPGVPSGLSEPHGLLLLPVLIFFSLNTLSGRGRSTQGVKAWMPPLVSWLEFPVRVMETGLEEPVTVEDIYGLDYNTGVEDVMGVEARNVEIDNLVSTLAFLESKNMGQQAENVKALLLEKLKGDKEHLEKLLDKRRKEMGDEIHR